ncbi:Signal transduction histidine kinase [Desulfacinum hydrothermale DSM 13146]|uniref:histidine kinase n=1 Tax=Desulfacinum hydrothermale DSM 13146 TaxID=1121390 RepID=A0A1W1XV12_9BACT|nr:ATP-binding protein [Desulfacinum hydrothermale]SMC27368.1 Signal transduction histidine kinase [Desulfacinum hydrothermale DSM 13146]
MNGWRKRFNLNIRQKVIVGMTLGVLTLGVIGAISYRSLLEVETKVKFVEVADDLLNTILELRRFEKNFFLYETLEAIEENERYREEATSILTRISPRLRSLEGGQKLQRIEASLRDYRRLMAQLKQAASAHRREEIHRLEQPLREKGKELVDLAQDLVYFERQRILGILKGLKTQLAGSLALALLGGVLFVALVARKIVRPLKVIERNMLRIAQGDFAPLPVMDTRDETQQVVKAFNRMVTELERRQDQLVQAKKLSSLGVLTSGVAHQLNNPLNNISTSCQILLEDLDQLDEDFIRRVLTNVEQEVARARDIVKGLLEFSRAKEFTIVPTNLNEVVAKTVRLISSQVPPGVRIETRVSENMVVEMDPQRMQQVFLNLFMNAIQAMPEGRGEIWVTAEYDQAAQQVLIRVRDTGCGMSEEVASKIFDPFFTTKEVGAGTGLGMSIAYGIVEKHRGHIEVESREGEGTTFTIILPVKRSEA